MTEPTEPTEPTATVHHLATRASIFAYYTSEPHPSTWSKTQIANTMSRTMCGIPAIKHGEPVPVGEHSDQWGHVTCAACWRIKRNCDEVRAKGWAGKAIRDVPVHR